MISEAALRHGATALGIALTELQCTRLLAYGALILKWNKVYNLTALREPALVLSHHLLDSLAVITPLSRERPPRANVSDSPIRLLDVGSGAGLPGAVIAILRDDIWVDCLDAVAKKTAFVQQVAAELGLPNLHGIHARVESFSGAYDIIGSRAFASLADFIENSTHLLAPDGLWLAMKGKLPGDELSELPAEVDVFHVEQLVVPKLDAERCIVWARKAPS